MPTPFQKSVWRAISLIPEGRVTTYGAIAKYLNSDAVRAIGTAVGKNPDAPTVPCHRVVKSNGTIGSYSGGEGTKTKIELLQKEGVIVKNSKIADFDDLFWGFS